MARVRRDDVGDVIQKRVQGGILPEPMHHESVVSANLRGVQQSGGERDTNPLALPRIGHNQADFRTVIITAPHIAKRDDVATFSIVQFRDQGQPPRVVHIGQHADQRVWQYRYWQEEPKVAGPRTQACAEFANRTVFAAPQRADAEMTAVR